MKLTRYEVSINEVSGNAFDAIIYATCVIHMMEQVTAQYTNHLLNVNNDMIAKIEWMIGEEDIDVEEDLYEDTEYDKDFDEDNVMDVDFDDPYYKLYLKYLDDGFDSFPSDEWIGGEQS